jgi:4-hydroxybenzoate polyprenyltransferase
MTGMFLDVGIPYYTGVLAAGGLQGWMIKDVDINDDKSCGMWFRRNVWTGGIIWLGCLGEWACRMGGIGLGAWYSLTG